MANYIEEMMKTAGVKAKPKCTKKRKCEDYNCINCDDYYSKYPDFTAEKQIEIIKILLKNRNIQLNRFIKYESGSSDKWQCVHTNLTFSEALAEFVNHCINEGVIDRENIKEILEG